MNYYLSIKAILTDELGDVLPPLHAWMVPVVEDMLRDIRARLTEPLLLAQVRQYSFMGDVPWERV